MAVATSKNIFINTDTILLKFSEKKKKKKKKKNACVIKISFLFDH